MLRMIAFLLLFSLFCSEVSAADYDMGKLIGTDCAVFRMKPDEFLRSNRLFFKWTSSQKDTARYPAFPNSPRSAFLGFRVYEAIATFQNETLIRFYLSLYNRGDAGPMELEAFDSLVENVRNALEKRTGEKGEELKGRLASAMISSLRSSASIRRMILGAGL